MKYPWLETKYRNLIIYSKHQKIFATEKSSIEICISLNNLITNQNLLIYLSVVLYIIFNNASDLKFYH